MAINTMSARTLRRLAVPVAALGLVLGLATSASAATVSPVNTTYDRPGITLVPGGNFEITWAGTDTSGKVNGALVNTNGAIINGTKWTDNNSTTYQGTGAAIAFDAGLDFSLIAWTDLNRTVHVALDNTGVSCESTGFGSSVDTPYLTVAANGTLYLTTVDTRDVMHVTEVDNNGCVNEGFIGGPGTLTAGPATTIAGNTSYNGPTLVDLNASGTPHLWLIWAGTNSAHNINIAKFTPGNPNLGTKYVETNHATTTDMGSTTFSLNPGSAFFTYCGTNNVVYGQWFLGTGPETEIALGGSCNIYTNHAGYLNGGVDVTYDPATSSFDYLFANKGNLDLTLDSY
ncbi:MAG TPA: hypothetical protein VGS19_12825 [Streptosporangiaceae bacterium]|nr:hypothetical protein [Streptosporangiaceae bacterium]